MALIVSDTIIEAIKVNAERGHFAEAYEGFNDCPAVTGNTCNCGQAEAEAALRELREAGYDT